MLLLTTVLLMISQTQAAQGFSSCREGWNHFQNRCYFVGRGNYINHATAAAVCIGEGALLAVIETEEENEVAKSLLRAIAEEGESKALIRGQQTYPTEWDTYHDFHDWSENAGITTEDSNCIVMSRTDDWSWRHENCFSSDPESSLFICETDPFAFAYDCTEESCYALGNNALNDGRDFRRCSDYYGFPAEIKSSKENVFVKLFLEEAFTLLAEIGVPQSWFSRGVLIAGTYTVTSEWMLCDHTMKYFDWYDHEQNTSPIDFGEFCIIMDSSSNFSWRAVPCQGPLRLFLCELPVDP